MTKEEAAQRSKIFSAAEFGLGLAAMRAIEGTGNHTIDELRQAIADFRADRAEFYKELEASGITL
jgi:hypothetical protein